MRCNIDHTLSLAEHKQVLVKDRLNEAMKNARSAARDYADKLIKLEETYPKLVDPMTHAGGKTGIAATMAAYSVHKPLRAYAAEIVVRLISERTVR